MNGVMETQRETIERQMQTPIEIALGIDENGMTTARALYEFLELATGQFSRWAKKNIETNEFYEENKDWWGFDIVSNGNKCKDYRLTTDFAKHLSMESHSAKGKVARQYFIAVEDHMKELAQASVVKLPQTPMELLELHYKVIKQVDGKVDEVDGKVNNLSIRMDQMENDLPVLPIDADRITSAARKVGVRLLGGKEAPAYKNRSLRQRVYLDIYGTLKRNFEVRSYKEIKRKQCDKAIGILHEYTLPLVLEQEINTRNAEYFGLAL